MVTREEFKVIAATIKAAYQRENFMDSQRVFDLWYSQLQDIDAETLRRAASAYIMSNHFPPTIADIRQMAFDLTAPADDIAAEEWSKLMRALGYAGSPEAADHWHALPETTKEIVGSYFEFIQWANMPTVDLMSVQRPMFIKRYEEKTKQKRQAGPLPGQLRPPEKSIEAYTPPAIESKESPLTQKAEAPAEMLAKLRARLGA